MADDYQTMEAPAMNVAGLSADSTEAEQRSALTELFKAEFSRIYGYVLSRSGSQHIAEDVAAETFAEAARTVKLGRGSTISTPWLLTVAKRRLIDHWRRAERHRKRTDRLRLERIDDLELVVPDGVEDETILAALASLPMRQRAALTLRYLDEYSVSEVAETLQITYKAAESLLSRARSAFAKALEESHA